MREILVILMTILYVSFCHGQELKWAKNIDLEPTYYLKSCIDKKGNLCLAGSYCGSADIGFGDEEIMLTADIGSPDIFIAKYDSSGNNFWYNVIGGDGSDMLKFITTDTNGNIYIAGMCGEMDFNPSGETGYCQSGIFLSKYDSNGNYIWAFSLPNFSEVNSITTDIYNNVYLIGSFEGTVDFDPSSNVQEFTSNNSKRDIFLAKYNSQGNYEWANVFGGSSYDFGFDIAFDTGGYIYITGCFLGTANFNPNQNTDPLIAKGDHDIFLAKYDLEGNYIWAYSLGGTEYEEPSSIITDFYGNVIMVGRFEGKPDFDPSLKINNLISNGGFDGFIAKYDPNGEYIWAKSYGGNNDDNAREVTTDSEGNIFVTGTYDSPESNYDGSPGEPTIKMEEIFFSKYDPSGSPIWSHCFGSDDSDAGYYTDLDNNGDLYLLCYFSYVVDFDYTINENMLNSLDGGHICMAKYSNKEIVTSMNKGTIKSKQFNLIPNPVENELIINSKQFNEEIIVKIIDLYGKELYHKKIYNVKDLVIDCNSLSTGPYFVRIENNDEQTILRMMKK